MLSEALAYRVGGRCSSTVTVFVNLTPQVGQCTVVAEIGCPHLLQV
jgi:hypothetical protein